MCWNEQKTDSKIQPKFMLDVKCKEENHLHIKLSKITGSKKFDQLFEMEELEESDLLSIALELFSNEQNQIFSAINFFDRYLKFYNIPLSVALEIQPFFTKILSEDEIPSQISEPSLRIISLISTSFSEKFDYSTFISKLWGYLPSSSAFDAISSIIIANKKAADVITDQPFLLLLQELFQSDDFKMQSGALGIFNSLTFYPELSQKMYEIFNQIFEFHKVADSSLKIQCYETFTNLVSNQYWCETFINSPDLSIIFQIDQSNNYDAQLLSALRFLNALIINSEANPEEIILKAESVPLIMNGFTNLQNIVLYESIYIVEKIMKKLKYIPEFIWSSDIINILYDKNTNIISNGDFHIFQHSLHCLCLICIRANDEQMQIFIENNLSSMICQFIDSVDQEFINDFLLTILKLMASSTSLGNDQIINELKNNEPLIEFLSGIQSNISIAILHLLSKLEIQQNQ